MTRTAPLPLLALSVALSLASCDHPPPAPRPQPTATPASFDNRAATQSIMRPKVIAEADPTPTPTPTPTAPTEATVLFPAGARLDPAARAALDTFVAAAGASPEARWILRGSSDAVGDDEANLLTSRRRAAAVRTYLVGKGIAADRIAIIALGERRPVAPSARPDGSDDPEGRARNRRVDIEIVAAAPPDAAATTTPE